MGKRIFFIVSLAFILFILGVAGLAAIAALLFYGKVDLLNNPVVALLNQQISASRPAPAGEMLTDQGAYGTENNWLAAYNAVEIADWAWLAVHPDKPVPKFRADANVNPKEGHVHLEFLQWNGDNPVSCDLNPAYAWDPAGYAPFARQLLGDAKSADDNSADENDFLNALLTPTGKTLAEKDVELSRQLQENPTSVAAHEKAALLLLSVAIRENAGLLNDTRRLLCRASAHLAVAQALRGGTPTSWTGRLADAAMRTVAGREVDAMQSINALAAESNVPAPVQVWLRALKLRNKMDWRLEAPDASTPLLLKLAWFTAVAENFDDSIAANRLELLGTLDEIPDWGRTLLGSPMPVSVDVGHRFCESTISLEIKELTEVLQTEGLAPSPSSRLSDLMHDLPGHSVTADDRGGNVCHVIGAGLFEDIARRHLLNAVDRTHYWMKFAWGVPEEDAKFTDQMTKLFQGVRHEEWLPVLLMQSNDHPFPAADGLHEDLAEIPPPFAFILKWPEVDRHHLATYFAWGCPFGTAYDLPHRCGVVYGVEFKPCDPTLKAPSFADLLKLSPDSYTAASWIMLMKLDHHEKMTIGEEKALLGPFLDYDSFALVYFRQSAEQQPDFTDDMKEDVLRKQAVLDPDEFFNLGDFLMTHGKADEAADAYRKGAAQGVDQVQFANSIEPLVRYDFDHGQQDEALSMAQKAAGVYSAAGIETYIWLLCKLNRYDEAEDWAGREEDRYGGNEKELLYAGHPDHYPSQFAAEMKRLFPNGMASVSLASFKDPPQQGCVFQTSSPELEHAGLRVGDVVVALDSHPVFSEETYAFVRAMSDAPVMDLVIWRDGKYFEVKASPPNRRFGNNIVDYHS